VLINNAGVFAMADPRTNEGLDARFAVNTLAPYVLACGLAGRLGPQGRIVNLSSAAQAPVSIDALTGRERLSDDQAYAQSKLALTMWTRALADRWGEGDPLLVAVNPGSLLASKMVRDAYGMQGKDIGIGADILTRAALSDEFASASGQYFDNDRGRFADPHLDALDPAKVAQMMDALEGLVAKLSG
jgi:NAD(P)-dependent dehydrogenase (short-subunit alcohol dehydrogenase family)